MGILDDALRNRKKDCPSTSIVDRVLGQSSHAREAFIDNEPPIDQSDLARFKERQIVHVDNFPEDYPWPTYRYVYIDSSSGINVQNSPGAPFWTLNGSAGKVIVVSMVSLTFHCTTGTTTSGEMLIGRFKMSALFRGGGVAVQQNNASQPGSKSAWMNIGQMDINDPPPQGIVSFWGTLATNLGSPQPIDILQFPEQSTTAAVQNVPNIQALFGRSPNSRPLIIRGPDDCMGINFNQLATGNIFSLFIEWQERDYYPNFGSNAGQLVP